MRLFFLRNEYLCSFVINFASHFYFVKSFDDERKARMKYQDYLANRVDKMLTSIESLAEGDLTGNIELQEEDIVIQKLYNGYNKAIDVLTSSFKNLENNIGNVTHSVDEVLESMQKLSSEISQQNEGVKPN